MSRIHVHPLSLGPDQLGSSEIFSFHAGGAFVLMADGSVHFMNESMDIRELAALVTRNGGETAVVGD